MCALSLKEMPLSKHAPCVPPAAAKASSSASCSASRISPFALLNVAPPRANPWQPPPDALRATESSRILSEMWRYRSQTPKELQKSSIETNRAAFCELNHCMRRGMFKRRIKSLLRLVENVRDCKHKHVLNTLETRTKSEA